MRLLRIASGAILVLCVPKYALGITPWLELGAYLPLYTITGDERALIDGAKVRALFVSPNARADLLVRREIRAELQCPALAGGALRPGDPA
jgi:hypothetical protein